MAAWPPPRGSAMAARRISGPPEIKAPATALRRIVPGLAQALVQTRHDGLGLPMHSSSKKGKAMACRNAISLAAVVMGISSIVTDASATCEFKAKKDIIVILDVGHTNKDSGQISARGVKEYDFNMNLARQVLEELVNTGFFHADDRDVGLKYTRKPATTIETCQ